MRASSCRVGVDLGGTGSRAVSLVDGALLGSRDVSSAVLGAGEVPERMDRLAQLIRDVVPANTALGAVGIGASGPVDVRRGTITNPDTLPWFSGFPLVAGLEERLGVPVGIDNDAVAAAYGEHATGAGGGADRMMMVTLGTGVGTAMLVDGVPVRGADGAHPEGGHIPIGSDVLRCYCGLTGCFEQAASRTSLQRRLGAALDGAPATKELIADAVQLAATDERVRAVFREYADDVARGLGALHTLWQPRVTVIGGSAAICLPLIAEDLRRGLECSAEFAVPVELRAATLGDDAGAVGAATSIAPAPN